jgi:protein-disulfide isomerase|tara:strand:- start:64 stop:657 length:594 start_codon:yes stop_codon:yes gene_type:complete
MKYNISKFLIIFIFLIFSKSEIINAKTDEEFFLGNKDAKITVIEYASMTCVHCANFHKQVYPKIKKNYIDTNKIKFIFRDFPLDKQALFGSVLAKCAPKDKYFDFVKLILTNQKKWISNDDAFMNKLQHIGKLAGLNENKINSCFKDEKLVDNIIKTRSIGEKKYNINSTPTLIINEKKYSAMSYENFEKIIENLIN